MPAIQSIRQRIYYHIYYSQYAKMITPVSRHLGLNYKFDIAFVQFIALEVVPEDPCDVKWDKRILHFQKETLWIERLEATKPPGINEVLSYKPFLWDGYVWHQ